MVEFDPTLTTITAVIVFTGVICALVILLSFIASRLAPSGLVTVNINDGKKELKVSSGQTLLGALANENIFIPSACGGGGTCAMCKCQVLEGGGDILATETGLIKKAEQKAGTRLSCQVKIRQDMKIVVPEEVLEIKKWECTVSSNNNVATFIKELDVKLPEGEDLNFKAGGYIQIDIPTYDVKFSDFEVPHKYREDWDKMNLFSLSTTNEEETFRAYSMANHPAEGNRVMLNVRIATPPRGMAVPPGIASSYIFNLKTGDKVTISGPYGEFFAKDTEREMIYIGGGAGMAPMRSHIFDLFHTRRSTRKVSYWYGARSKREIFYEEDFSGIEKEFDNFSFHIALSEPLPEDNWDGPVGFIHQVVLKEYLDKHPDPTEVEYYLCGPPMMISAVQKMLYDLGVEPEMIAFDEF
ncbi:MAG: NADH:ubiquinone reductase (Na(+)-transporting) subunit F [Verrucomicrobia bacterium]|nr:NADH:ubiquinone reductase (Na(+)-transporting) subunit F [Verrucomicrobiota bacterium]